jgi:hypothetical protein
MKAEAERTVVVVGGDAGGARAMAPVLELLRSEARVPLRVFASRAAPSVWSARNLPFEEIADSEGHRLGVFAGAPALLMTGTSYPPGLELTLTARARERGIASAVLLDFWSNYADRFRMPSGETVLPDRILVMDEEAREEMVAAGFDAGRLLITGQPALGELAAWRAGFPADRAEQIRTAESAGDRRLVLFVSQPLSQIYGPGRLPALGYDEHTVLRILVEALSRIAARTGRGIALVVKPHPRDPPASLPVADESLVHIGVSRQFDARELAMAADLVVGMNSELLVESCALGRVTLSLQPGLRQPDVLPTNRLGLSRPVYDVADVDEALESLLFDDGARESIRRRLATFQPDPLAARRVADLVYEMTGDMQVRPR